VCGLRDMQLPLVVPVGCRMLPRMTGGGPVAVKWLEMPVAYSDDPGQSVKPKYAIEGSAVVLYKKDRAYVGTGAGTASALLTHPDVIPISPEARDRLEKASLVNPSAVEHLLKRRDRRGHPVVRAADRIGLGDAVSAMAHRLGISECSACARRRAILNRLTVRRWWHRSSHR